MTSAEIREKFLAFFESKGHHIVPSAPIVLKNDPSLLFTNAGMNQFKDYFLGNKKAPYKRVADTQKCLRVSGKHNDLEEVGVDTYHHTMFEMLGNWSFGDYFKKEAILWSWELLTDVYGIDKNRLYATVFEGDEKEGIPASKIALGVWKALLPDDHIVYGNKKDNFWEMGETGPCGPCSEIHVDCRSDEERAAVPGHLLVNKDHPQVIEIWNNVFIQYNRLKDGSLQPLAETHVDTGMGLERLVRVLQGKTSNYDTDLFQTTIATTEKISGKKYTASDSKLDVAFRVLADHIRAIAFTIADGQLPSNTGAGYVIRRILRRAVRYSYSYLDVKDPILYRLLPGLAEQFKQVFPELNAQLEFVSKVVKEEEETFLKTLGKGLKKMDEIVGSSQGSKTVSGVSAFELYDTYGFPLDLTRLIAVENGLEVNEQEFEKEMQVQKNRSRSATASEVDDWIEVASSNEGKPFVGYDQLKIQTRLIKYRQFKAKGQSSVQVVLEQTPFYAESGGQIGDTGFLLWGDKRVPVLTTKKENDLIIHTIPEIPENPDVNVVAEVDENRRKQIANHHSLTHLVHAALRSVLGKHVEQKGSLVSPDGMRFDFSHFAKMSDEELTKVTALVNQKIRQNIPVHIQEMHKDDAIKKGAMALFGEKYTDTVRVVTMDEKYSIELCGGTHVAYTGELGQCIVISESGVAAGVRRIECVCADAAESKIAEDQLILKSIGSILKNPKDLVKSVEQLQQEYAAVKKKLESAEQKMVKQLAQDLIASAQNHMGVLCVGEIVELDNLELLKKLAQDIRTEKENVLVIVAASISGKSAVAVGISDALVKEKGLDANAIIKNHIAPMIQGGGGGQKGLATAGGQRIDELAQVVTLYSKLI